MQQLTAAAQLRQQRRENLQRHIEEVNAAIRPVDRNRDESGGATEGDGDEDEDVFEGFEEPEPVDREDEYIDEDKYTTVTIESVGISKEGFEKVRDEEEDEKERFIFLFQSGNIGIRIYS